MNQYRYKQDRKKSMANGRVDVRTMKKTGKARLRFYDVYPELLETIFAALAKARKEGNTHSDTVALSYICMDFISTPAKKKG